MAKMSSMSWQCNLSGPQERLEYLFNTGCFSDITIKFPGEFSYELHRIVLATCSPVFEAMMFGPLATSDNCLYLEDDHHALKYVFAHCYGCDFQYEDINVVLEMFKIADKYIINHLKNKCTMIIKNLTKPENFKSIYDFSVRYGFTDIRNSCIRFLKQDTNNIRATAVLMWFSLNSPKDLLMPIFAVEKLSLDTWRKPKSEPFGDLVTILQSNCCNNLKEFSGQVSGDVIKNIPGPLRSSTDYHDLSYAPVLKLSLQNGNAKGVIMGLHERYKKYGPEDIGIHITNEDLLFICKDLSKLPCYCDCDSNNDDADSDDYDYENELPQARVTLYFSDIIKENLYNLSSVLDNLQPACRKHKFVYAYMFPSCKLTKYDFRDFGQCLFYEDEYFLLPWKCIWMFSSFIEIKDEEHIFYSARQGMKEWKYGEFFPSIKLMFCDNDIPGW